MIYVLDTIVVSEVQKLRPHGAVVDWIAAHEVAAFATPAVVFFELQRGAELTRQQDSSKASQLDSWIEDLISVYSGDREGDCSAACASIGGTLCGCSGSSHSPGAWPYRGY